MSDLEIESAPPSPDSFLIAHLASVCATGVVAGASIGPVRRVSHRDWRTFMTPTEDELLAAIDEAPHEDAPRLAHADWLEAHGDPDRADYIRGALDTERDTYYRWVAGLPTVHGMAWESRRGYPEVVRFRSLTAFKKGWPLTTGHRVRHVAFSGLRGGAKLADEPALASITSLELSAIEPTVVLAVLRSPHLGPLHHLAVGPAYPDDLSFLPGIAQLPLLAGLRSLHYAFFSDGLLEQTIAALLGSPYLGRLRELRLEGWLGPEAMRALWRSSSLANLTTLELLAGGSSGPQTRPGGLEELGDGSAVPALERFRFTYSRGATTAGRAVAGAHRWDRLRVLDLQSAKVGDAGAAALAGAAHLSRLESLNLRSTGISDAGARALGTSPHLSALTVLDLSGNMIGREGVAALGRSDWLASLRALSLAHNPAPTGFAATVEGRFREGGPPVEEAPVAPALPVAVVDVPVVGADEENALVRAIWADPYDDLARNVYADWLEEQGKPVHAATLRADPRKRAALAHRLQEQVAADAPCAFTFSQPDDGLVKVSIPVRFLRSKAFEHNGPAWLRRHHVAEVCPVGVPADWAGLFAAGWVPHIRGLTFQGHLFQAFSALAASPHLAPLASLTFGTNRRYGRGLPDFFRTAGLCGLCRLRHPEDHLGADLLRTIGEAPFVSNLRHLSSSGVADDALAYMCEEPVFAGLVTLKMGIYSHTGMKILADARGLGALRNLDLSHTQCSDWGADALAGSALLARLQRVRLNARQLSASALGRLARAIPAHCRLALTELPAPERDVLAAVLGDRLVLD